ncbi:hypothetical protein M9H77_23084 [Catharanthus roseus]|uniref:Uncharacterized protein n=1 Tax=Catharanthus roseus TaxID=4058 RepID=A0ACC0ASQ2_CATRO|nr:hypothetical protein M9H77_23084 [Catharanthus roseus]
MPSHLENGLAHLVDEVTHFNIHRVLQSPGRSLGTCAQSSKDQNEKRGEEGPRKHTAGSRSYLGLAKKTYEHKENDALMPTDMEMMYESQALHQQARAAASALFPVAPSVIVEEVDRVVQPEVHGQIVYDNYLLHEAATRSLGEVGISMSNLGSLEPPPNWQMRGYPSSEGTSG